MHVRVRIEWRGMSYGSASKRALALVARAAATGSWFDIPEKLIELRAVMQGQMARAVHGTRDEVVRSGAEPQILTS